MDREDAFASLDVGTIDDDAAIESAGPEQCRIEHVGAILESLKVQHEGLRYALVVHAGFRLRDTQVTGYMVIVLSVASLDRLIRAVEDWERSQS